MSDELEQIWSRVQDELEQAVGESTYRIWLEGLRGRELSQGRLRVEAPPRSCGWIRDRFGRVLQSCTTTVVGQGVVLELVESGMEDDRGGESLRRPGGGTKPLSALREGQVGNPKLSFDQFVIGERNRLAHAAALTVAEMPAQAYNPLFICGPPGVGKTHLLSSLANLLRSHDPGLAVRHTTGEAFTNEFIGALSSGGTESFKASFRQVDVLLVDDVQFLERKAKTEEEFFHTFNFLYDAGRQIVLSSDRPPRDLQALEDRLRERFESGLVAEIEPPELTTRLAILRKRAQHDHIDLQDEQVLRLIAERVTLNVRSLEGALIRVVAFSSLTGRPLTGELTREVLDGLYPPGTQTPRGGGTSASEIQAAACKHFGLSREELLSTARNARVAWPRQLAMYLTRELTDESLPAIGRHFGGRDHTTVLHACRRTSARIAADEQAREAVEKLCSQLGIEPRHTQVERLDRPS